MFKLSPLDELVSGAAKREILRSTQQRNGNIDWEIERDCFGSIDTKMPDIKFQHIVSFSSEDKVRYQRKFRIKCWICIITTTTRQ